MLDLSPEIAALPGLRESERATLLARERREVFSIHPEIRILAWGGAMLIAAAAALLVRRSLDRLGPTLVAAVLALAAAACYAWGAWRRGRATVVDDYVLLLASLLLSAELGFLEAQFDVFGAHGHRHFLILAIAHGLVAYWFDSRLVLTLAVSALAAWIGVERSDSVAILSGDGFERGLRLLLAATATLTWREADRRYRPNRSFERPLEHFTANFVLLGGVVLASDSDSRWAGLLITGAAAAFVVARGLRTRTESFVLYAFVYLILAVNIVFVETVRDPALALVSVVVSAVAAIAGLFVIHARFQKRSAS